MSKLGFNLLIASKSLGYIPVIRAIVPPDTQGTISAAPIAIPFKKNENVFFKVISLRFVNLRPFKKNPMVS